MKTKIYSIVICFLSIYSFLFTSCDEGDTTKPVIELIEPEEGAELLIGGESGVHFEMELSDNEQLASYKVEIHNNIGSNYHEHGTDLRSANETDVFAFEKTWNISGRNTHIHHHEIMIPANATEGNYHLMVYCTDAAGNESYVARNIVLSLTAVDDDD